MKAEEFYEDVGCRSNPLVRPLLDQDNWSFRLTDVFACAIKSARGWMDWTLRDQLENGGAAFCEWMQDFCCQEFESLSEEFPVVAVDGSCVMAWDPWEYDFCLEGRKEKPSDFVVDGDVARQIVSSSILNELFNETYFLNTEIAKRIEGRRDDDLIKSMCQGTLKKWIASVLGSDVTESLLGLDASSITPMVLENFVVLADDWDEYPQLYKWNAKTGGFDVRADVEQYQYSSVRADYANDIMPIPRSVAYALMDCMADIKDALCRLLSGNNESREDR